MDILIKNLRFAFRSLRKNPSFTAVALVTMALGIGANTAIFSVVRGVVLSPLPYPQAERIVQVWPETTISIEHALFFQAENRSFEAFSAYGFTRVSLTGDGRPEQFTAIQVLPDHFAVMGVEPTLGRTFAPEEREPGRDAVAIISDRLWRSRFGGDPNAVGKTVTFNGRERTVVGVMPASYRALSSYCDVWLPLAVAAGTERYTDWWVYRMIVRLAPDVTGIEAQTDVRRLIAQLRASSPDMISSTTVETATVPSLLDQVVGQVRPTLWILFGAVGLVLLIACSNVANLLLARSTARQREVAVRSALGAGSGRLLAQFLTESLLLAVGGGMLGVLAASWTVSLLSDQLASSLPQVRQIAVDSSVLLFALAASVVSGLLFGLLPALRSSRPDLQSVLKSGGRGSTERQGLHYALVAAEIALSVVLVVGAGLLVKSFWQLRQVEVGFSPHNVLSFRVQPPGALYDSDEKRRIYFEAVEDRLAAVPGVTSVGAINLLPMRGGEVGMPYLTSPERPANGEPPPSTTVRMVTPGLMETLRIPLLRGRQLAAADRAGAPRVGLVNQALARQAWGDEDPVGKKLFFDDGSPWFAVVGVVGDIRQHRLDQATQPQVYVALGQESWATGMFFTLRSASSPLGLLSAAEKAVWSVDGDVPVTSVALMEDVIHRSMTNQRQLTGLFALFAGLALVLAAVGVYGVTAYTVSQRTHETGVRIALGATGLSVLRTNLSRVMVPVALGLGAGLAASWGLTRLLESLLFEVRATDPSVFVAVAVCLAAFAVLAGYLPARRAARVDPMVILGTD